MGARGRPSSAFAAGAANTLPRDRGGAGARAERRVVTYDSGADDHPPRHDSTQLTPGLKPFVFARTGIAP